MDSSCGGRRRSRAAPLCRGGNPWRRQRACSLPQKARRRTVPKAGRYFGSAMTQQQSLTLDDLALFADLGTTPPRLASSGRSDVVRLVRNGREIELVLHPDGVIQERTDEGPRRHVDARALLASPNFGDLGRWADAQKVFLSARIARENIPIQGSLSADAPPVGMERVDAAIIPPDNAGIPRLHILLVDGPAGIGKTSLVRALAHKRATGYRLSGRPLILHVESRGRMLQNIMDLMAFSLQNSPTQCYLRPNSGVGSAWARDTRDRWLR